MIIHLNNLHVELNHNPNKKYFYNMILNRYQNLLS